MAYKLYTDKQEVFECDLFLEGASIKDSSARIIVETNDLTLMFKGEIDSKGNCKVPIKKLKGLMNEDTKGNIKLEVIAEDTLIEPWQSEFVVSTSKKVTVEIKSQEQENKKDTEWVPTKPKVIVNEIKNHFDPVDVIANTLQEKGITIKNVIKDKKRIAPILENYSTKIKYNGGTKKFIREVIQKLAKS